MVKGEPDEVNLYVCLKRRQCLGFRARVWGVVGKRHGVIVVVFLTLQRGIGTRVVLPMSVFIMRIVLVRRPVGVIAAGVALAYYLRQRRMAVVGRCGRPA